MLVSGSKKGSRTPLLVSSSCRDSASSSCFCSDGGDNHEQARQAREGVTDRPASGNPHLGRVNGPWTEGLGLATRQPPDGASALTVSHSATCRSLMRLKPVVRILPSDTNTARTGRVPS